MLIPVIRPPGLVSGGGGGSTYTRTPIVAEQDIPAGFPVMIHADMFAGAPHSDAIFSNIQADGGDLRVFADSAFATQLPLELISINTGAPAIFGYFRTTGAVTSGNTIAYLRTTLAGGQSQPAVSDTYGRNAVWQDYLFSSHDIVTDSSGNRTISNTGGAAKSGGDLLNGWPARGYGSTEGVGTTDISTVNYTGNPTQITISCLLWRNSAGSGGTTGRIVQQNGGSNLQWTTGASTNLPLSRVYSGTASWAPLNPATGSWFHYLATLDSADAANDPVFYADGSVASLNLNSNSTGALQNTAVTDWRIANNLFGTQCWDGRFGGMRWRASTVNATWAAVEAASFIDPAAVATAGALVTV